MTTLSNSLIESTLRPYGVAIESEVADKIRAYVALLLRWNKTISLTTVTDPEEIREISLRGESFCSYHV